MNRLDELIDRFLDDSLTSEERIELKRAIDVDSNGADQLLAYYQQNRILSALFRPSSADAVDAILAAVTAEDSFVDSVMREARADAMENNLVHDTERKPCAPAATPDSVEQPAATPSNNWFYRLFPRPLWAFAAAAVMFIGFFGWLFLPASGEPTLAVAPGTRATLERNGQSFPAQDGLKLLPGDLLRISGSNGAAIGYGKENTRFALNDDAELKILAWQKGKRFELQQGKLEAVVARQRPWTPMVLVTAQAEARVLGTKFTLAAATNSTRLEVTEGNVKLTRTSDDAAVKVDAGYSAIASDGAKLMALPFTGRISREYWTGISGLDVGNLTTHTNYSDKPSGRDFLNSLEEPANLSGGYVTRIRGYLYPPKTGHYRFWIAADDRAELYLSLDDSLDQKDMIASLYYRSKPREWTKYPWQQSSLVKLKAGRGYYIEVLHSKNSGTGHLAVSWQTPGGKQEIIPVAYLAPFQNGEAK